MHDSLVDKIEEIYQCLTTISQVESELLDTSLLSIFKAKNHLGIAQAIDVVCTRLKALIEQLEEMKEERYHFSEIYLAVLNNAIEYSLVVFGSANELQKINIKLYQKIQGEQYSLSQYHSDKSEFNRLKNIYLTKGYRLNSEFNLYSRDLEKEEEEDFENEIDHKRYYENNLEFDEQKNQLNLAYEYYDRSKEEPELLGEAVTIFKQLAEEGFHHAQYMLGYFYLTGIGTEINNEKGMYWMEKAAPYNTEAMEYLNMRKTKFSEAIRDRLQDLKNSNQ